MFAAIASQLVLLVYHQATTLLDLFPFNGARNYTRQERFVEMASNVVLMSLAPIGFAFHFRPLQIYGAIYYFVLFAIELVIWWVPYFFEPRGALRRLYNFVLAVGTSNFQAADTLVHWHATYERIHAGTITLLPKRAGRIVPNLEHTLLHAWTLITALVTCRAIRA